MRLLKNDPYEGLITISRKVEMVFVDCPNDDCDGVWEMVRSAARNCEFVYCPYCGYKSKPVWIEPRPLIIGEVENDKND